MRREPQYEHDCEKCVYLSDYGDYDLYWCPQDPVGETVLARFGNEGPDYVSCPPSLIRHEMADHPLPVAVRRAMEMGLIRSQDIAGEWRCREAE